MNETDIRKYAGLMQELGLTGLEITEDNKVVRLERSAPAAAKETENANAFSAPVTQEVNENDNYISVKSPMVGVFYTASAEDSVPYVAIGDRVKKGQLLCIIEAMKLMNEIIAEDEGVISEICATNGQVVEFGTVLFRIKR
ncbi:MAG: biotin/lipoyl-containing protein [Oscillospiraceae bacterium]|nr:biotin/lipoyl-containing protein [Oscillospiraceae bacterium]